MAIKTYKINSNLASYTDEEFSTIENFIATEGVFDVNTDDTDLKVTESTPNTMTVDVATGAALVTFLQNAVTWKVVSRSNTTETLSISANATGNDRVDTIVIHLKQDEPNALKTNVAELRVLTGTGTSALIDSAINTTLGDTNWYRLANITVPNGASSIINSYIADTRVRVMLDAIPTDGDTRYVTTVGDQIISGTKTFQTAFPEVASGIAPPTTDYQFSTKKYVDDTVSANLAAQYATNYIYGETITSGNILYQAQADKKVYKITSDPETWGKIVGVAEQDGIDGSVNKNIKTRGDVVGSFSAIAPDFDDTSTGSDLAMRATSNYGYALAFRMDNTAGPEAYISGTGDIMVRKVGAPTKDLSIGIFLGNADYPYGFRDNDDNTFRVVNLDSDTIAYASITTLAARLDYSLSAATIPANSYTWFVAYIDESHLGTYDSSNYYIIDGVLTGGVSAYNLANWYYGGTLRGNYTIPTSSINPWDSKYAVRAYGNATDGGFGIGEASGAPKFGRVLGYVKSATEWFIDMNNSNTHNELGVFTRNTQLNVSNQWYDYEKIVTEFRPSRLECQYVSYYVYGGTSVLSNGLADYITEETLDVDVAENNAAIIADSSPFGLIPMEDGYYALCTNVSGASPQYGQGDDNFSARIKASQE